MVDKTALFWKKVGKEKAVQCQLCPHYCIIGNGEAGKCRARQNVNGKLISLVYGKPVSVAIDPIEKKPLYHFLPGEKTFSFGTVGCNLKCLNCQNAGISQASPENFKIKAINPTEIVKEALKNKTKIISYTYTEPTVFYEYVLDISKIAKNQKKDGMKNVIVSNGFINEKPLKEWCKIIDGANIDLKSISEDFYERICEGKLNPVLETIKTLRKKKIWVEITNLVIPGVNDSLYDIRKLISWVIENIGVDVPLHFSAFYPCYKMDYKQPTDPELLKKARKIAMEQGLRYVYTGNILDDEGNNTYCPRCKKAVIIRHGFEIISNKIKDGKCSCGEKIAGVWE
ncbi:MAG: AmmeMemoRadiSam system radical SAM enzyme [Nanoarchaeota archaeon]|nr:AmmeMemoRadiSam system radical SAM enzyme [Nanoarchaeota archaeon]